MTTIKKSDALQNLEQFMNTQLCRSIPEFRRSQKCYKLAKEAIETGKVRPNYQQGSGKFAKIADHESEVKYLLLQSGVEVQVLNDAPRNGRHGVIIKAITE